MTDQATAASGAVPNWRDRSRLIDFFKRVFALIVGLAITEACRRLLPAQPDLKWPGPSFWMFLALFITILPIFHGGDRSLDVRHLDQRVRNRWQRLKFVWDVYALLATGLLLVCAADAIPDVATIAKHDKDWAFSTAVADFYRWLFVFFIFNVLVLIVDRLTTQVPERLASYKLWIAINLIMALASWAAVCALARYGDVCLAWLPFIYCLLAVGRTLIDYLCSDADFMFP